jgi:hypothetical protein
VGGNNFFFSMTFQSGSETHPVSYKMTTQLVPSGVRDRSVAMATHPYLPPKLPMCRVTDLLSFWAYMRFYRVTFTFTTI